MKQFLIFLFVGLAAIELPANVAQPGIWSAGGTGTFSLLYPEDSASYKKISMVKERVWARLYPGYAVIKGQYILQNTSDSTLRFHAGYPVNGMYEHPEGGPVLNETLFDSLYAFQFMVDGEFSGSASILQMDYHSNGNWYVWDMEIGPQESMVVEVKFIVNTNHSQVIEGYDRGHANGFLYILQTGSIWKGPVGDGKLYIQLMDGLVREDVAGVHPAEKVKWNPDRQVMMYGFEELTPDAEDNLVITYGAHLENFDFRSVISDAGRLYEEVDDFSRMNLDDLNYTDAAWGDPYDVPDAAKYWFFGIVGLIILMPVLMIIGGIIIIRKMIRKRRA